VCIPEPILPVVVDRLGEDFDVVGIGEQPDGALTTITVRVDGAFLDAAPSLRIVANYGVGVNNVDLVAAAARGVVVTNTPDVLTAATAELAVGLMLALLRRIAEGDRMLRAHRPWEFRLDFMLGRSLEGATVAIVGPGRIGSATARLVEAFGASTLPIGRGDPIDELLPEADVVSIHAPLTEATFHLFDAERIARLKPTAVLVNTARGPLVDESALARALEVDQRLLRLENVLLTPHLGSATRDTREAMGFLAARSLREYLVDGRRPATAV
jgi:glyoxylate reductase